MYNDNLLTSHHPVITVMTDNLTDNMTDNMTDITGRQVRSDHITVVMNSDYANNHVRYHAGSRHNEWSGIFNRATHHITEGDCVTQRARVPHRVLPPPPSEDHQGGGGTT